MDNKQKALELGQKPVGALLWQYALPAIVAMTASSLYNIIDRASIGQVVGADAINGLTVTFRIFQRTQRIPDAFGAAVGVGASTCISVRLGQKDYKRAENLLGNTVTLNLIIGFAFMAVCMVFLDPILYFFGASDVTLPYAREFMEVILAGNMVTHMYFGMNAVLRASGKPKHAMYATLFTVGCNIVLVVAFVWWFRWGIRGAALATITSQTLALCWQLWIFSRPAEVVHIRRDTWTLRPHIVGGENGKIGGADAVGGGDEHMIQNQQRHAKSDAPPAHFPERAVCSVIADLAIEAELVVHGNTPGEIQKAKPKSRFLYELY